MKCTILKLASVVLTLALAFSIIGIGSVAFAASTIYINDSNGILGVDIGSAYVIGSGGTAVAGDSYVITGSGTTKVGQAGAGDLPSAAEDGSTVSIPQTTVKIGLYYYYSADRDSSLESASLKNEVGSGYEFGYYDSSRVFHSVSSTAQTQITMKPTGSGREVTVYITGTNTVLYTHSNTSYNLAVHPLSSGKAQTWFKGNTYYGDFEYYRYISNSSKLTVINVLNIEDYVKGVVPIEMSTSWPIEALKAQALCARTYAAKSIETHTYAKYGFDITDDTYCQAYVGTSRAGANSDAAVDATRGKYITYNGALCTTFYFSSDGGGTESNENVFVAALPYCRGVIDPYEESVPATMNKYKSWSYTMTTSAIVTKLGTSYGITSLAAINATYSATGNVIKLEFVDVNGNKATVSKTNCNSVLDLPSIHYTITKNSDGSYTFAGSGWGHNVGMSQFGAYAMAQYYGCNYLQIIRFYFSGVNISIGV
jgi:stage II sporulation protein D